jgi:hypothetical protein
MPGTGEREELKVSYAKVRELKARLPGLKVVSSHDAEAAKVLEHAPLKAAIASSSLPSESP